MKRMRLINKFTVWYLAVTFLVLAIGGLIVFYNVQKEVDDEVTRELRSWLDNAAEQIKQNDSVSLQFRDQVEVREIGMNAPEVQLTSFDTIAMHKQLQRMERHQKVKASYKINGKHYLISAYDVVVEPDDITDAVTVSFVWILGLLVIFVGLLGRWISHLILSPFQKTMKSMQAFRINQDAPIHLDDTGTREFAELNRFLQQMTKKAVTDYRALKEFSENASHEIQTPLSVIRGKLELLMGTPITEQQAALIEVANQQLEKLSKVTHSLNLLTKLSNQEFATEPVNMSQVVKNHLTLYEDLIKLKALDCSSLIEEGVEVIANPMLADILVNNLLNNAIHHNRANGSLHVHLDQTSLKITNTGEALKQAPEMLFERFRKGNQSSSSTGLGLAIVKQICDLSCFSIDYHFRDGLHELHVRFKGA